MRQFERLAKRLLTDRRAATAVEYGLILALVFLAMIGAAQAVGRQTIQMWEYVSSEVLGTN